MILIVSVLASGQKALIAFRELSAGMMPRSDKEHAQEIPEFFHEIGKGKAQAKGETSHNLIFPSFVLKSFNLLGELQHSLGAFGVAVWLALAHWKDSKCK